MTKGSRFITSYSRKAVRSCFISIRHSNFTYRHLNEEYNRLCCVPYLVVNQQTSRWLCVYRLNSLIYASCQLWAQPAVRYLQILFIISLVITATIIRFGFPEKCKFKRSISLFFYSFLLVFYFLIYYLIYFFLLMITFYFYVFFSDRGGIFLYHTLKSPKVMVYSGNSLVSMKMMTKTARKKHLGLV